MQLRIEGKNAAMMMELLKNWQLTDGNGIENDSLSMTLFSENVEGIPAKGEKYQVYIGNTYRDEFQISKRSVSLRPSEVRLVLCVAPFNILDSTGYRERKSSSWDNTTISQVASDCVVPHGFSVFVHPELQNIQIEHIDRTEESTAAFIYRLAKLYDAVAKIVDGTYVIAPKGKAKSATGKEIETITLSLSGNQANDITNVEIDLDGRDDFLGVKGYYLSTDSGERVAVVVGSSPCKVIRNEFSTQPEAEQACSTELRRIQREGQRVTISALPNEMAFAEGLVVIDNTFPSAFRGTSSIDSVCFSGRGRQAINMTIQATLTGE
ncbi:contractile injection system protein, VgrG/Pvc8 family [Vibrio fluvialis]|uniref:contractile injection system protein, VgrG/Pvc8 family n=1 Tax=Vibrio fluvialis TaxID=676 RepID=UPI0011240A3D|nr:contractile injection system protein, VgrG/Pvc8 family [Vibrio fluvialis]TOY91864.1 hypothetical protein DJ016_18465 [Vibrio fluvialis]TRN10043.1 hypothetical protein DM587_16890 [Vibrio fluvialis]